MTKLLPGNNLRQSWKTHRNVEQMCACRGQKGNTIYQCISKVTSISRQQICQFFRKTVLHSKHTTSFIASAFKALKTCVIPYCDALFAVLSRNQMLKKQTGKRGLISGMLFLFKRQIHDDFFRVCKKW